MGKSDTDRKHERSKEDQKNDPRAEKVARGVNDYHGASAKHTKRRGK